MPTRGVPALRRIAIPLAIAMAGAAVVTAVVPALASGRHQATTASHRPAPDGQTSAGPGECSGRGPGCCSSGACCAAVLAPPPVPRRDSDGGHQLRHVRDQAGWANNGYYGGDLVTAATICVAESAGDPNLIVCDNASGAITGHGDYPKYTCPAGTVSYDRGLWQLNTKAASTVSNKCAFNPVCNADQAYVFSGRGTSFVPGRPTTRTPTPARSLTGSSAASRT